ncbi:MAG: flavodoxin domain-containing protein [Candidatus Cloacimonetes bacterium]|nr:flavodoxin domain-containing protein [Candidatus Cloacimonadota bacterium]
MKTGIIYISKHGTTEKVAKIIAEKLNSNEIELINLRENQDYKIENFNRIIIGGSIHIGSVYKKLKKLCESNESILTTKIIGLFLCCAEKDEKAINQFDNSFSEILRLHAVSTALLGYEFNFEKMNFIEKTIIKKISGIKESISEIDYEMIGKFVNELEPKNITKIER